MMTFMFGVLVGIGAVLLLGACLSKWGHTHKLKPRSLTQMRKTHGGGGHTDITEVLYVCSCGHAETREFTGSWKLVDFQVSPAKGEDKELERLRRMAGMEDQS